jgi:outer membrane protein assembly factor BamB
MVTDGRGGWFVAMPDYCIGDVFVNGIAHLRPDGRLDKSWHGRVPRTPRQGAVGRLDRVGNTLYAASGAWVEALNARTGARRWLDISRRGGWGLGLAANWRTVFVGGYRGTFFKGKRRSGPVALDARTGKVLPWHAALERKPYAVGPLALDQGRLFMAVNTPQAAIVAVNARTGRLTGWRAPQIKEAAGPFLVTHGLLVTTGLDGEAYIANASTGQPVPGFGHQGVTDFSTIAVSGNTLYAWSGGPGCTRDWQIQGQTRSSIAAIDLRTLKLTSWAPILGTRNICISGIAADPSQILVTS